MSKKKNTVQKEEIVTNEVQNESVHPQQNEINQIVSDESLSKSQKIRKLWVIFGSDNRARSSVAKVLNIRYQHVRNVLITPLKKG